MIYCLTLHIFVFLFMFGWRCFVSLWIDDLDNGLLRAFNVSTCITRLMATISHCIILLTRAFVSIYLLRLVDGWFMSHLRIGFSRWYWAAVEMMKSSVNKLHLAMFIHRHNEHGPNCNFARIHWEPLNCAPIVDLRLNTCLLLRPNGTHRKFMSESSGSDCQFDSMEFMSIFSDFDVM